MSLLAALARIVFLFFFVSFFSRLLKQVVKSAPGKRKQAKTDPKKSRFKTQGEDVEDAVFEDIK